MATKKTSFFSATRIALIALFGALAGVLHVLSFQLPFLFPGWLEFDFSDIPLFIGTFALGPVSGCIIVLVKILVRLVCRGTGTMFVGDLANLIIGWAFVIPAGLIYKKTRTKKGAVCALLAGSVVSIAVAIAANRFVLVPFYVSLFGGWDTILGMARSLFPAMTRENFYGIYLWASVLPFNALRCLIAGTICFFIYKHISRLINRTSERFDPKMETGKRSFVFPAILLALLLLLVLFAILRYFLWS